MELETPRRDTWYAELTEEQLWQLYGIWKRGARWFEVAAAARDQFGCTKDISMSAFYRWSAWMRRQDADNRRLALAAAQQEAAEIARARGITDAEAVNALKTLAIDAAMKDNSSEALKWANAATAIQDRLLHAEELKLKTARQSTLERQLALAREKFEAAERRENAARSALGDTKLTDAAKIAKMKEIFG